jgi:phospholipid/cholesterol/gamma-HCH transport system substrate-binding protein
MTRTLAAVAALLVVAGLLAGCGAADRPTHIRAEFRDAIGLYVHNDVAVLGVKVGTIDRITPEGTHVAVDMTVQPGIRIPADAAAVTVSPALVNNRRVELTPVYRGGPVMPDGAVIPMSRTRTPVEVDEVFNAAEKLSSELGRVQGGKAALSDALDAAAGAFQGNGAKLHQSVKALSATVGVAADQRNELIQVIKDVDDLTQKSVRYDGTIHDLVGNLARTSTMLDQQGPALSSTIDHVDDLMSQVDRLIEQNRDNAGRTLDNVQGTARSLARHRRQLAEGLDVLPTVFQNLVNATDVPGKRFRAQADLAQLLLPPQLLQGICQQYQVPLLCQVVTSSSSSQGVAQLATQLLGANSAATAAPAAGGNR